MLFKKKRESDIKYDKETDTFEYLGDTIHVEELPSGRFLFRINGKDSYHSQKEFMMMYMFFSLMYRRQSGE